MPYVTRDQVLSAADIQTEAVDVPEWGGTILVRGLTGAQRDELERFSVDVKGNGRISLKLANYRAKLVSLAAVDEDGQPLFTAADVEALGKKSGVALDRVAEVAARLSGLSSGNVEDATKN